MPLRLLLHSLIVFILLSSSFSDSAWADEDNSFGIVAGGTLANVSSSAISDAKTRPGLWLGLSWELPLTAKLNFAPEFSFVQKGYDFATNRAVRLYYVEVPLLVKFKLSEGAGLKSYVFFGPGLGYIVQKSYIDEAGSSRLLTDSVSPTNLFELSAQGGIGFEFPVSEVWRMGLQARYAFGLTSPFRTETVSNRVILIGLTVSRSESYKYDNVEVRALEFLDQKRGGGRGSNVAPVTSMESPPEISPVEAADAAPADAANEVPPDVIVTEEANVGSAEPGREGSSELLEEPSP